jgi:hypothetical protein
MRRVLLTLLAVFALMSGPAEAVTVRDVIELSKAGLGDEVLLALIEIEQAVFTIDTATLKKLKEAGVSQQVIVAMIKSGRSRPAEPVPAPASEPQPQPEPQDPKVIVIDHRDAPAPAPVAYPVAVPVYVPVATGSQYYRDHTVSTILSTDQGLVRARVPVPPNCIKAQPVYWGFGGQLRPGSWQPPPTVVCR